MRLKQYVQVPCFAVYLMSQLPHHSWQSRYPTHFQRTELVISTHNPIIILVHNYYTSDSLSPNLNFSFFPHILFITVISYHSLPHMTICFLFHDPSCAVLAAFPVWWLFITLQNPAQITFLMWNPLCEWHTSVAVCVISVRHCLCLYLSHPLNFELLGRGLGILRS